MLVLSRKIGEKLVIGDNITVVVNRVAGNRVTLGIEAPGEIRIIRGELREESPAVIASPSRREATDRLPEPPAAWTAPTDTLGAAG
jgi:carbon storage regulator